MTLDDETLMAFADGELPAPRAAEVEKAVAADPALAAKVARFRAVKSKLAGSLDGLTPRPDLMARAQAAVAAQDERRRLQPWPMVAAAGVAGLVVAFGAMMSGQFASDPAEARGALAVALAETPSGQTLDRDDVLVAPLYTVVAADGRPCRGFRTLRDGRATEGAACRRDGDWRILAETEVPTPYASSVFAEASGDEPAEVAAALDALDPGDPLTSEAERALIARRWARE